MNRRNTTALLCAAILLVICLCGCTAGQKASGTAGQLPSLDSFDGQNIAILSGSVHDSYTLSCLPHAELHYYNSTGDLVAAVKAGLAAGMAADASYARDLVRTDPTLVSLSDSLGVTDFAFAFGKSEGAMRLCGEFNEFLAACRADGTLGDMESRWLSDHPTESGVDLADLADKKPSLVFATTGDNAPFSYYLNGEPTGFDVELAVRFCRAYGYGITIKMMDFDAILPGIASGKYNFAGNSITVTPERAESVTFSDPVGHEEIFLLIKDPFAAAPGFFESLKASFQKTFIRENRWQLIVRGIGTTVFISVLSALFGTLLGFGLCLLHRLKNPVLHTCTTVYIRILQGTPLVVLLMILFYLVFAKSGIAGEWVAIIAFSLNFSAYVGEMIRTGIEAVDPGQTEAALAIGFTRAQTFGRIVLPQAAQHFLPVYKGEFISLVKMTSVVGYIAVQDLTKMSDIIRSRTYEAFFPLIATAIIYFVISSLLAALLQLVEIKIKPDRQHRTVKGVDQL